MGMSNLTKDEEKRIIEKFSKPLEDHICKLDEFLVYFRILGKRKKRYDDVLEEEVD